MEHPEGAAMRTDSIRRKILPLLLVAAFATPWALEARPQPESPRLAEAIGHAPFLGPFWGFLRGVWEKEGCNIDPWGRCGKRRNQSPPPLRKAGCNIDPLGRCVP